VRLATIKKVRLKNPTLFEGEGVDDVINEALDSATLQLSKTLNTGFDRQTVTDTFMIDQARNPRTGTFIELLTSNGFVDLTQAFTLKLGANVEDIDSQDALVITQDYTVKGESGHIFIYGTGIVSFPSRNVLINEREAIGRATYTCGFNTEAGLKQIQEIELPFPLIAGDVLSLKVDGTILSKTYDITSNSTLAVLASQIESEPGVATATVTDVGGGVNDDRVIVVTALTQGSAVTLSDIIITRGTEEIEVPQRETTENRTIDPFQYDQSEVPEWLKEVASIQALININNTSRISADSDSGSTTLGSHQRALQSHLSLILDNHLRSFGAAIKPQF